MSHQQIFAVVSCGTLELPWPSTNTPWVEASKSYADADQPSIQDPRAVPGEQWEAGLYSPASPMQIATQQVNLCFYLLFEMVDLCSLCCRRLCAAAHAEALLLLAYCTIVLADACLQLLMLMLLSSSFGTVHHCAGRCLCAAAHAEAPSGSANHVPELSV